MILLDDIRVVTNPRLPLVPGLMRSRGWKSMSSLLGQFDRIPPTAWEEAVQRAMALDKQHVPFHWGTPSGRSFGEITEEMPDA